MRAQAYRIDNPNLPDSANILVVDYETAETGRQIQVIENRDGANRMHVRDVTDGTPGAIVAEPEPGVVASHAVDRPLLSADGSRIFYALTTPRLAGDVFVHDTAGAETRRSTAVSLIDRPAR